MRLWFMQARNCLIFVEKNNYNLNFIGMSHWNPPRSKVKYGLSPALWEIENLILSGSFKEYQSEILQNVLESISERTLSKTFFIKLLK